MRNKPIIMNQMSNLFKDNSKWDGKIKVIQKPLKFETEQLESPLFNRKFLNFNYLDVIYCDYFLENLNETRYFNYATDIDSINSLFIKIRPAFENFCKFVINKNFKLIGLNNNSLFDSIECQGNGCISLFYLYSNLLFTKGNFVINNVESHLHSLSLRNLKFYIENKFNSKIIFLMNRYDLFNENSKIENLYLLKNSGKIKSAKDIKINKEFDKYNLEQLLMLGKFGKEWQLK